MPTAVISDRIRYPAKPEWSLFNAINKPAEIRRYVFSGLMSLCFISSTCATNVKPLDDTDLSEVRGRDGLSFAANLNVNIGSVTIGVSDSANNPATLALNNSLTTGTIAGTMDVLDNASTGQSYLNWAFPQLSGANLQYGYDLLVSANGTSLGTGIQFNDIVLGGTSMQLSSNSNGVAFGLGLNLNIGDVFLQPNGRGNTTGQLALNNISFSAAGSNGTAPWILADLNTQPGFFNVTTDSSGNPEVQWGIDWPTTPGSAASGSLQIGNIVFTTPTGNISLGSSSIGSIQIQYLNVKLKP